MSETHNLSFLPISDQGNTVIHCKLTGSLFSFCRRVVNVSVVFVTSGRYKNSLHWLCTCCPSFDVSSF